MVSSDLHPFMIACMGAAASFIGLLFVGLSVVLQKIGDDELADTDRILAESSYAGLINIFFVCLVGTLPNESIGVVSLIMATLGLLSCLRLRKYSLGVPLWISATIYVLEVYFGLEVITHPDKLMNINLFQTIIIALFAISLFRAWGLTGIRSGRNKSKK